MKCHKLLRFDVSELVKENKMYSKMDVHNKVYESELNDLKEKYKEKESRLKESVNLSKSRKEKLNLEINALKSKYDNLNKNSRLKDYARKSKLLESRLSAGVFFAQEGVDADKIELSKEKTCIYFVLIRLATMHGSWVNQWCNKGLENFSSSMIVELYEYIKENIYMVAEINKWGQAPFIDQWMQVMDVELDYSNSKRICKIETSLEELRKEGMAINHQINYGSIVCGEENGETYYAAYPYGPNLSAVPKEVNPSEYPYFATEEQFLSGIENITTIYLDTVKEKSKEALEKLLEIGRLYKDLNETDEEIDKSDELLSDEKADECENIDFEAEYPEYFQRDQNVVKYIKSQTEIVKRVLEEKKLTVEEAINLIEKIK